MSDTTIDSRRRRYGLRALRALRALGSLGSLLAPAPPYSWLMMYPVLAAITVKWWGGTGRVWFLAVAVTLAVAYLVHLAVLIYVNVRWAEADPRVRRATYTALHSLIEVSVDVALIGVVLLAWVLAPATAGPVWWRALMVAVLAAAVGLDLRAARLSRKWRPWVRKARLNTRAVKEEVR